MYIMFKTEFETIFLVTVIFDITKRFSIERSAKVVRN